VAVVVVPDDIEALKAINENVLTDLKRLMALEDQKRTVDPGSTRFDELSVESERLAERLRDLTSIEHQLGERVSGPGRPTLEQANAEAR
jgi:hypothetical protein